MTVPLKKMNSSLHLKGLALDVHLGWPQAEREKTQAIILDIKLHFLQPPRACSTDDLEDTHCYDTLVQNIRHYLNQREFRLIEHLGKELYQFIKLQFSKQEASLTIRITKKPTISNLNGGVSFCYGDSQEEPTWSS